MINLTLALTTTYERQIAAADLADALDLPRDTDPEALMAVIWQRPGWAEQHGLPRDAYDRASEFITGSLFGAQDEAVCRADEAEFDAARA